MKSVIRHAGVPTISQFAGAPGPAIVIDTDTGTQYWLDASDTVTEVAGGSGGLTTEQVDDRVAALLVAGTNVTLTYNDAAGTLTVAASGGGSSGNSYFPSGW